MSKNKNGEKLRVRWAFDPFDDHTTTWERTVEFLIRLSEERKAEVVPTFVLGTDLSDWVSAVPNEKIDLVQAAKKVLHSNLKRLDPKNQLCEPELIRSSGDSKRSDVATLLKQMEGFDLLVINTHARKGLQRFFMGSFAESLLLKAGFPIIFLSPNTEKATSSQKVLFPSDLSKQGRDVFEKFLASKYCFGKSMVLYSKVLHPATAFFSNAALMFGGSSISLDQYLANQREIRELEAEAWKKLAEEKDLQVKVIIDDTPTPVPESIIAFSKDEGCDMIAMPSFATQVDAVLAGSNAREVVRQSQLPVLVCHVKKSESGVTLY